jgi:Family of unknown function (DUF6328)
MSHRLDGARHVEYFVTLSLSATAAILLIPPTAYHRLLFRCGDKKFLVIVANRLTLAGGGLVGVVAVNSSHRVVGGPPARAPPPAQGTGR